MSENKTSGSVDALSKYRVGQVVNAVAAELDEGKTSPPPRYNQSSLMDDMLNAGKFAKNAEDRAMLRETEGIGTGRTRGPTIAGLIRRKLLESKKKGKTFELRASNTARQMMDKIPPWLKDVSTTAKWELMLAAIERGEVDAKAVVDAQSKQVSQIVERARNQLK